MPQFGSHLVDHSGIADAGTLDGNVQTTDANPMAPLLDERAVSLNGHSDEQIKDMLTDLTAAITIRCLRQRRIDR